MAEHKVGPEFAVYAASKFAVRVLAEGPLQEVKAYNIRTTVISPGAAATNNILRLLSQKTVDRSNPRHYQTEVPRRNHRRR